jgi:hypothetical protein
MEDLQVFFGEKEGGGLAPEGEKYITAYPLAEWKKLAVCNFLVSMRSNGFSSERRQLDNKGGGSRSGRP